MASFDSAHTIPYSAAGSEPSASPVVI